MRQEELDAKVDDLLSRWHDWREGYRLARGYASSDATCRQAQSNGLYDRENGALDDRIEKSIMTAVDKAIDRVPNSPMPWNTCLHFHARNLFTGREVWFSTRLPRDHDELHVLLLEARNMLVGHFMDLGLIS